MFAIYQNLTVMFSCKFYECTWFNWKLYFKVLSLYLVLQSVHIVWDNFNLNFGRILQNGSAYHCFCSPRRLDLLRKQTAARGEVPKYDNRCRHLSCSEVEGKLASQLPYVVRFKVSSFDHSLRNGTMDPLCIMLEVLFICI